MADATPSIPDAEEPVNPAMASSSQGLLMTVEASTPRSEADNKGKKKRSDKEAEHSKSKKSSKSARSDKDSDKSEPKTSRRHSSSKGDQGSLASSNKSVQPSPIHMGQAPGPFSPLFPINTSGLWCSGTDLQSNIVHDVHFGAVDL